MAVNWLCDARNGRPEGGGKVGGVGAAGTTEAPVEEPLDYVRLVDEEHEHRRTRRKQGID